MNETEKQQKRKQITKHCFFCSPSLSFPFKENNSTKNKEGCIETKGEKLIKAE